MVRRELIKGLAAFGLGSSLLPDSFNKADECAFADRLLPAPVGGGFAMDGYWVWCGSVIKGDEGKFHMFASRWPKAVSFSPHWLTNSEVVRAVADRPEGPYRFAEVVLPARGPQFWDGLMTHNPSIHRHKDTYLLFYTGTTYEGDMPTPANFITQGSPKQQRARANQRIGIATASSLMGPWKRQDTPIIEPRPGRWDGLMTTNAAPCVRDDGRVLLIYKSTANQKDLLRMGVAQADRFDGTYKRLTDESIFNFDRTGDHVEDGYLWWQDSPRGNNRYNLLMKDMKGGLSGEQYAGVLASSPDGIQWQLANPAKAYSRTIHWNDGHTTTQGHLERPQLLIQSGQPTHLFFATGDGPGGYNKMSKSWNMVIPLKRDC